MIVLVAKLKKNDVGTLVCRIDFEMLKQNINRSLIVYIAFALISVTRYGLGKDPYFSVNWELSPNKDWSGIK